MKLDFLIVGATKCSTTSIYYALSRHPDIQLSLKRKESNFFIEPKDVLGCNEMYKYSDSICTKDDYDALFDTDLSSRLVGEVCTSYFHFSDNCIPQIKQNNSHIKIIILLRDPVKRMLSNYTHNVRDGFESRSLKDAVVKNVHAWIKNEWFMTNLYQLSKYSRHISNFQSAFQNTKVFILEDYQDISLLITDITTYLNISKPADGPIPRFNFSGIPSSTILNKIVRSKQNRFTNIRRLCKILFGSNNTENIKTWIDERNLKKLKVSDDELVEYYQFFKDDINKTGQLLNRDLSEVWKP